MAFAVVNRNQGDLIGFSLNDFVSADARCRFIVEMVKNLDLSALYESYSELGTKGKDPAVLLATWFFAYTEHITSTRRLEQACARDLHFLYVSGNLHPDHSTLSRFRQKNLDLLPKYFLQLTHLGMENGFGDFKDVATDGSKMQAACSRKKSKNSDELQAMLRRTRQKIDDYMKECDRLEAADVQEGDDLNSIRAKLKELREQEQLLLERQQQLNERLQQLRPEDRENHSINLTEPDAPMMKRVNGDKSLPAYNAQITVDTQTMLIGAEEVVQDRNDSDQLKLQLEALNQNVGEDPERKATADSGYHSLEQLEYVEEHHVDAVIADPTPEDRSVKPQPTSAEQLLKANKKMTRSDFAYHAEEDYYECPMGEKLEPLKKIKKGKRNYQVYTKTSCQGCVLAHLCLAKNNKAGLRSINREAREPLAEKMYHRLQTDEAKARLKRRAQTVEPVFGTMKENLGFRRFRLRGLKKVRGEFALMCIAYNLARLYVLMGGVRPDRKKSRSVGDDDALFFVRILILLSCARWAALAVARRPATRAARAVRPKG